MKLYHNAYVDPLCKNNWAVFSYLPIKEKFKRIRSEFKYTGEGVKASRIFKDSVCICDAMYRFFSIPQLALSVSIFV